MNKKHLKPPFLSLMARLLIKTRGRGAASNPPNRFEALFKVARRQAGLDRAPVELSSAAFRRPRPASRQMDLFPDSSG